VKHSELIFEHYQRGSERPQLIDAKDSQLFVLRALSDFALTAIATRNANSARAGAD
jgi:hypothetical protein